MKSLKRFKPGIALCCGLLLIGAMVSGVSAWDRVGDEERERIAIGFDIAPVPLNLENKSHDLVGLGSYIGERYVKCRC